MKHLKFALAALLISTAMPVSAATVIYLLGDHLDAALFQSDPLSPYGLRFDAAPPSGNGPTFSVGTNLGGLGGATTIMWDPLNLAAGASISGTLERNDDGTFWTVAYTLSDLTAAEFGGFKATSGSGSVAEIGGAMRSIALASTMDEFGVAFEFEDDGHRLDASDGWVGRGWVLPKDSTNDWILTGVLVPIPAALWLFGSALGLLGWIKRRQST